jgi:hypothetical protein
MGDSSRSNGRKHYIYATPANVRRPSTRWYDLSAHDGARHSSDISVALGFRPQATTRVLGARRRSFAQMAANGLNAVRTYALPPEFVDQAQNQGVQVIRARRLA